MEKKAKAHMDLIFPVVLFLVFTLTALFVILYAARTYQHIVDDSNSQYESSTSLAYLVRKIHASDKTATISLDSYSGNDAIAIRQEIEGAPYVTYIYASGGSLRELFTADNGANLGPEAGTVLFPADSFSARKLGDKLIEMEINSDGKFESQYICLMASGGGL